jgi:hypothetical protein
MTSPDPGQWISSSEAVTRLRGAGVYERTLCEWLAQGLVISRARLVIDRFERRENVTIDGPTWKLLLDDPLTRFDWLAGTICLVRLNDHPHREFRLFGLTIAEPGLAEMVPGLSAPTVRGAGGAPKKTDDWTALWLALVEIAHEGRLNTTSFQNQAALRAELLLMVGDGLSERTIKPVISQVWRRLVEPHPREK